MAKQNGELFFAPDCQVLYNNNKNKPMIRKLKSGEYGCTREKKILKPTSEKTSEHLNQGQQQKSTNRKCNILKGINRLLDRSLIWDYSEVPGRNSCNA